MLVIKAVTVQLNTSPQYVGNGEAGGGGAAGTWDPQQAYNLLLKSVLLGSKFELGQAETPT